MQFVNQNVIENLKFNNEVAEKHFLEILNSQQTLNAINLVKEKMASNDPSHDFFHVLRVMNLALLILGKEFANDHDIDVEVVLFSALFHDIADFKYDFQSEKTSEELIKERLSDFFSLNHISEEKIEKIIYIVSNISFRKELEGKNLTLSKEFKIVRDADRLEAIGSIGVARCFGYSSVSKTVFYDASVERIQKLTADIYNKQTKTKNTTAFNHFHEKVLLLKDRMLTETGKAMSESRHRFIVDFLGQFEAEMNFLK